VRCITRRAACLLAIVACMPMSKAAAAEAANLVAAPDKPALVPLPPARAPNAVLLDLFVRAYAPPRRGSVEAVVALGPTGKEMEIGRFAVFPSEPFLAASPREQRAYRFDASAAFAAFQNQPLFVQVRLVPTDAAISPEGAKLTLSRVEINPRPAN
jgi:hypothetical protein